MENKEDINDWQHIEQQYASSSTTSPEATEWNIVVIKENQVQDNQYSSSSSSSSSYEYDPPTPTNHHELSPQQMVPTMNDDFEDGTSKPLTASSSVIEDEGETPTPLDWRLRVVNEGKNLLKMRFEAMRAQVVRVASKVSNCAILTGAFWSIKYVTGAAVTAVVLMSLVYVGIRRRRRRVGLQKVDHSVYLKEKDEKIEQLLLQIAQLNEVLSSRRKVPVYRISG